MPDSTFSFCTDVLKSTDRFPLKSNGDCDGENKDLTFLWRIRRKKASYMFGTIHVPYTRVWASIPNKVKRALQSSDRVMFELNLLDPQTELSLFECQLLPKGVKARDVLPNNTYSRIVRHLEYVQTQMPVWMSLKQRVKGIQADYMFKALTSNWERKRPFWILLMINSLTEQDIKMRDVQVLDKFLALEAQRLNKDTGAVERVEEQCHPLNQLNSSLVLFALNQALNQHESIRRGTSVSTFNTDHLIQQYMCGDFSLKMFDTRLASNVIEDHTLRPFETRSKHPLELELDRYFRQELILKRNLQMGRRIVNLLRMNPNTSFFFAFGAGHFLGNESVVEYLRHEGIDVVRVPKSSRSSRKKNLQSKREEGSSFTNNNSTSSSFLSRVRPVFLSRSWHFKARNKNVK